MKFDLQPFLLTFELAALTTALLYLIGLPVAYFLAHTKTRIKPVWEAVISLPLILPPSVLGFYFLLAFSKTGFLGAFWERMFGHQLAFSFDGLVLGSMIFSLPFMVHPLLSGFSGIDRGIVEASYTLGKSRLETLRRVILPNMKGALLTGGVLAFAHTVGEFGVVLMIGGSIPGKTKVASIAIYDLVESLNYYEAHVYAGILFTFSFAILITVYLINKRIDVQ